MRIGIKMKDKTHDEYDSDDGGQKRERMEMRTEG